MKSSYNATLRELDETTFETYYTNVDAEGHGSKVDVAVELDAGMKAELDRQSGVHSNYDDNARLASFEEKITD